MKNNIKLIIFALFCALSTGMLSATLKKLDMTLLLREEALTKLKKSLKLEKMLNFKQEETLRNLFAQGRTVLMGTSVDEMREKILQNNYSCLVTEETKAYLLQERQALKAELEDALEDALEKLQEEKEYEKTPQLGFATFQATNTDPKTAGRKTSKKESGSKGGRSFADLTMLFDSLPPLPEK